MSQLSERLYHLRSWMIATLLLGLVGPVPSWAQEDPAKGSEELATEKEATREQVSRWVTEWVQGDREAASRLVAAGPQVVPWIREDAREVSDRLPGLIYRFVVAGIEDSIAREAGLLYRGQFRHLAPLGAEGVSGLLTVFRDEDRPPALRVRAAMALGDLTPSPPPVVPGEAEGEPTTQSDLDASQEELRENVLSALREVVQDFLSEPWFEQEAGYLMARLGDRTYVEPLIERWTDVAGQNPTSTNFVLLLTAHQELSEVHYRIGDYPNAVRHYQLRAALLEDLLTRVKGEQRRAIAAELALLRYNLSCSLSLSGRYEEAFSTLETALLHDDVTIGMIDLDGDLRGLRADRRFDEWRGRMQERAAVKKREKAAREDAAEEASDGMTDDAEGDD